MRLKCVNSTSCWEIRGSYHFTLREGFKGRLPISPMEPGGREFFVLCGSVLQPFNKDFLRFSVKLSGSASNEFVISHEDLEIVTDGAGNAIWR